MTDRATESKEAMLDGAEACRNGLPLEACGYADGSWAHNAWVKGWLMAYAIEWKPARELEGASPQRAQADYRRFQFKLVKSIDVYGLGDAARGVR